MQTFVVLTAIGPDRPGLVEKLSTTLGRHGANWLESSMSQLAGQFAGIVRVGVDSGHVEALLAELAAFSGLDVIARIAEQPEPVAAAPRYTLTLVGHDRLGIVREVTQVLARHAANVESLNTFTSSAPMSAETLFNAHVELSLPAQTDLAALQQALERISNDLMVDIDLAAPAA